MADNVCVGTELTLNIRINFKTTCSLTSSSRSLSDNRYECLIFCGAIMQKKQDWACKTTSQITHS